jgi:hypothetical protein
VPSLPHPLLTSSMAKNAHAVIATAPQRGHRRLLAVTSLLGAGRCKTAEQEDGARGRSKRKGRKRKSGEGR